jgi:hypothetical protein
MFLPVELDFSGHGQSVPPFELFVLHDTGSEAVTPAWIDCKTSAHVAIDKLSLIGKAGLFS